MNWTRLFTSANVFIYKASNGRLGNRLGAQAVLVLFTLGRKTGRQHATTLSFYRHDGDYLVVASNWGKESHPGWYYNLLSQPRATIQVGSKKLAVQARPAEGEEYGRLWKLVTAKNEQYIAYQSTIQRRIPIVILSPTSAFHRQVPT